MDRWIAEAGADVLLSTASMSILDEANKLVEGDRGDAYGHPSVKYKILADLWSAVLRVEVTPQQVVLCFLATKLGREAIKHKRDNLVDIAGYAKVLAMLTEEE